MVASCCTIATSSGAAAIRRAFACVAVASCALGSLPFSADKVCAAARSKCRPCRSVIIRAVDLPVGAVASTSVAVVLVMLHLLHPHPTGVNAVNKRLYGLRDNRIDSRGGLGHTLGAVGKAKRTPVEGVQDATGWGVYRLCDVAGVTPPTMYKARAGKGPLPGTAAMRLARAWAEKTGAKPAEELAMARRLAGIEP